MAVSKQQKRGLHAPGDTSSQNQVAEPGRSMQVWLPQRTFSLATPRLPARTQPAQKAIKGQPHAATRDAFLAAHTESKLLASTLPLQGWPGPIQATMRQRYGMPSLPGTLTIWGTDASITWYACSCICVWGTECISHEFCTFLPSTLIIYSQ